jgi:hypothetical protein
MCPGSRIVGHEAQRPVGATGRGGGGADIGFRHAAVWRFNPETSVR